MTPLRTFKLSQQLLSCHTCNMYRRQYLQTKSVGTINNHLSVTKQFIQNKLVHNINTSLCNSLNAKASVWTSSSIRAASSMPFDNQEKRNAFDKDLINKKYCTQISSLNSFQTTSKPPVTSSLVPTTLSLTPSLASSSRRHFNSSIVDNSPTSIKPYLKLIRFDKQIGTWLLYLPCTWSICMAASPGCLPDVRMLALFGTGALLMRSAGCVINDLWDRDIDKQVSRTKSRPLASGELTPLQGLTCLAGLLTSALMILLSFNWYSIILGASSVSLVVLYPLMKRITYWPQAVLGLTMNWGCLLGWSAVQGSCDWSVVLPLYAGGVFWTLIYDTIYAHQDKVDDIKAGVKSTALLFGDRTKPILASFTVVMATSLFVAGHNCAQEWMYYVSLMSVVGHMGWQISSMDISNPDDCASKFKSNKYLGMLLTAGIVLGTLCKKDDSTGSNQVEEIASE